MLPNKDDPFIWRGPRKNGFIKQFLTNVICDDLDYHKRLKNFHQILFLIVDTLLGNSCEHISVI